MALQKPEPIKLILSAKRNTWRMADEDHEEADAAFRRIRPAIIERDRETCRCCGFKASKFQEVHHLDDNHANNDKANLATVCFLCHNVFHIGRAGMAGESYLIWLPEMSQGDLHHIFRAMSVAIHDGNDLKTLAEQAMAQLDERRKGAIERIGTDSPVILGRVLIDLDEKAYASRGKKLAGIRLMPTMIKMRGNVNIFDDVVSYWKSKGGPFYGLGTKTWGRLFEEVAASGDVIPLWNKLISRG